MALTAAFAVTSSVSRVVSSAKVANSTTLYCDVTLPLVASWSSTSSMNLFVKFFTFGVSSPAMSLNLRQPAS